MAKAPERKMRAPTGAILSKYLRSLAVEIETIDDDGDQITKAAALAALVWRYALGFEEADPDNPDKKLRHQPDWRAIGQSRAASGLKGRVGRGRPSP